VEPTKGDLASLGAKRAERNRSALGSHLIPWLVVVIVLCLGQARQGAGQGAPSRVEREVRARNFVVVDDAGNKRGELGLLPSGEVRVVLRGKGKRAAYVGVDSRGMPLVALAGARGEPILELGALGDAPVLVLRDAEGHRRIGITVGDGSSAGIGLYDLHGTSRCLLSLGRDGHPQLSLSDDRGTARASIVVESPGTNGFDLTDERGRVRLSLQLGNGGQPAAAALDASGRVIWRAPKVE